MDERPVEESSKAEPAQPVETETVQAGPPPEAPKVGPAWKLFRVQNLIALLACLVAMGWAYRSARDAMRPSTQWAKLLRSGDVDDRQIAARQLGDSSPEEIEAVVPMLINAMSDEAEPVRAAVALGLGSAGLTAVKAKTGRDEAKEATQVLTKALADSGADVRMAAAQSLAGFMASPKDLDFPADPASVASAMVGLLADPSVMVRARGQAALAKVAAKGPIGPPAALVEGLNSWPLKESREAAAGLLGSFPADPEPTVRALIQALKDKEPEVRGDAAVALQKFGADAAPALPSLVEALSDPFVPPPPPPPRFPGIVGVPSPGGGSGGEGSAETDPASQAARAIGRIVKALGEKGVTPPASVVEALTKALHADRPALKDAAGDALQQIGKAGSAAIPDLIGSLVEATPKSDAGFGASAATALGEIAPGTEKATEAIAALTSALGAKESSVRRASAEALGKFGPAASSAVPRLRELDKDPERDVKRAAGAAADRIEGKAPAESPRRKGQGGRGRGGAARP